MELKPISPAAIPSALEKAERYRLLNEPRLAQSICQDILEAEPGNQKALVMLLLSLTDQFGKGFGVRLEEAQALLKDLKSEYERCYFSGVILERWGKSLPSQGAPRQAIHDWLREAMDCYEKAEAIRPKANDDAILRWNTCARMLQRESGEASPAAAPRPTAFDVHGGMDEEVPTL